MSADWREAARDADWAAEQRPARPLSTALDNERQRFFLWAPVTIGLGIAAYFSLPVEPPLWLSLVPLAASLFLCLMTGRGTLAASAVIAVLLATMGFALAKLRVESVRAPVLERQMRNAEVEGQVIQVEPRRPRGVRMTLKVISLASLPDDRRPEVIRVRTLSATPPLSRGDVVRLKATLAPPAKPALPGGFDFARTAWFEKIGAVGFTFAKLEVLPRPPPATFRETMARAIDAVRQTVTARIHAALPGDTGGIAAALITGERGGISPETNDAYRSSGIFHILSISGLHMVIMAGAVFFSVRLILASIPWLALRYPIKKWAAVAGMIGALAYLSISGGAFATVRSALMIMVIFSAVLLDRPAIALRNIALSALLILLVYPESLFDAGFQMSFAAVTALVAAYEEVRRRADRNRAPRPHYHVLMFFGGIVVSTLIASAAVAPFAAYHFHQSQQYAVITNLVAVPLSNFWVMPAALVALIVMPLGLEGLPLYVMGLGIDLTTWCAKAVAGLPGAVGHIPAIPWTAFGLMVFGGLWVALWTTRLRIAGGILCLVGLASAPFMPRPDILVARNGELVAVRSGDGHLSALPARQSKYELQRWLESDGDARKPADVQKAEAFACDGVGCVADVKGARIAVTRHPAAVSDDCRLADIAVLNVPRPEGCNGTRTVIDFFDVWRDGTHALYIEAAAGEGGIPNVRIDTVAAHRGDRPWSPKIERKVGKRSARLPVPKIARPTSGPATSAKEPSSDAASPPRADVEDDGDLGAEDTDE